MIDKMKTDDLYAQDRSRMVKNQIESRGVRDSNVLESMRIVPRHCFVPSEHVHMSYADGPLPIGDGQTISQPYIVALMTELLKLTGEEKVLEIGTGSGYQAAVLLSLGAKVFTIERYKVLNMGAQDLLPKLGYRPHFFYGDGYEGLPTYAPFDKIIITAAAFEIPHKLIQQLKINGKMVLPLGGKSSQIMTCVEKTTDSEHKIQNMDHSYLFLC